MNRFKPRLLLLASAVLGLGIALGTALWLKLAPQSQTHAWNPKPLEGLSHYGAVPDFSLIERSGKTTSLADLRRTVWIADFIYTSCTDTCPLQTAEMAKLQEELKDKAGIKLISFSVDPERDTPPVLSRYADRFKADANRWLFLTGGKEQIVRLAQEGFRLSAAPASSVGRDSEIIFHSTRFVLVDKEAQIRGYYDSRDADALQRLKRDVATLLKG